MSARTFERRSLELTNEQWAVIEQLAAQTASLAPSGPTAKTPSWRTLIKRIADGDFLLIVADGTETIERDAT